MNSWYYYNIVVYVTDTAEIIVLSHFRDIR